MTDEKQLELLERVYSKLKVLCKVAAEHEDPREEQVLVFNEQLRRLIAAGLDVGEWLIPEQLLRPMYGHRLTPDGRRVDLKRVSNEEFFLQANPAMGFVARELNRRRETQAGGISMTQNRTTDPSEIWVIHGQDEDFRESMFNLLRAVHLRPIEFIHAVSRSGSGAPVILDLVLREIHNAPAVISLMTPDEYCVLRKELRREPKDDPANILAGYQPRPNVLLETGIALGALRDRTVLVVKEQLRNISNLGGIHAVRWDNSSDKRAELVERLRGLGMPVVTSGSDWRHV